MDVHRTEIDHVHQLNAPQLAGTNQLVRDSLWRGSGGWEIAAAPVAFGLLGWVIDGAIGIRPVLTVVFAVIGLGGAFANLYIGYTRRMRTLAEQREATRIEKHGPSTGQRFARTVSDELPTYVVPADVDGSGNRSTSHVGEPGISTEAAASHVGEPGISTEAAASHVGEPGISTEVAAKGSVA